MSTTTRQRLEKMASFSNPEAGEYWAEETSSAQVSQQILEGAYGAHAQKALMGIKEAQAEALSLSNTKIASDPWDTHESALYDNPEESRQQRLNTLLRRY